MSLIRAGSRGIEVARLHERLAAIDIDQKEIRQQLFGPSTAAALRQTQADLGLAPDGIAGPLTLAAIHLEIAPRGYADILEFFGDPKLGDDGEVDQKWEQQNLVLVRNLPCDIEKLYVHKKVEDPLRRALTRAERAGWEGPRDSIGCFNPRKKRGVDEVSAHAFAAAVDIDPNRNPLLLKCPPGDPRRELWKSRPDRVPDYVIYAFLMEGWSFGGHFYSRFDPQHFQYMSGY